MNLTIKREICFGSNDMNQQSRSPRNENLNLLVQIKFSNLFYIYYI